MSRKFYWGITTLIILIIGVSAVMIMWKTDTKPPINVHKGNTKPLNPDPMLNTKDNPPDDEPGFIWEWHHNHWHKVPVSEAGKHDRRMDPVAPDGGTVHSSGRYSKTSPPPIRKMETQTYFGPLTYHEELLEKHPVKALILQSKELGHWSADWILPLPPDDEVAQAYAKTEYLRHYYESIKDTNNPIYKKASEDSIKMLRVFRTYPYGGRVMDLMRLTWPSLRDGTSYAVKNWPSEYLGIPNHNRD